MLSIVCVCACVCVDGCMPLIKDKDYMNPAVGSPTGFLH